MEQYKDYYKIMGIDKKANEKEIKAAYRKLARKYHPDVSKEPNAEEQFKEVGEAYEVLKDPAKRKTYDDYVQDIKMREKGAYSSHSKVRPGSGGEAFHYDEDFFESIFGTPFRGQNIPGTDYQTHVRIHLEDAYHGTVQAFKLSSPDGGSQTIRVKIPAGIKSGQKIRVAGQGGPGRAGGSKGDLYVTVNIAKHPVFDVRGKDVYMTLPIAPWEAALGAHITVPTLGGSVDLKVPPGSQGGQTLRLKKRGMPGQSPGNQYVMLKIVIPQPSTDEQRALYQKMQEQMSFNPRQYIEQTGA